MRSILSLALAAMMAIATSPVGVAALQQTGGVQGIARNSLQQPLGNVTVQMRNVQTGQVVGSSTANAAGEFSFAGINPGNFVLEIVNAAGQIVGTATVTVTAGVVSTVAVTATALGAAALAAGAAGGLAGLLTGTSLLVITAAAVTGFSLAVVATKPPASPSR